MSNRITDAGRIPLIPEPLLAANAGSVFSKTRAMSEKVTALGRAFFELPTMLWNLVRQVPRSIDAAMQLRDLASLSDHRLADMGIRRDQLPQLYLDGRIYAFGADIPARRKHESAI